MTQYQRIILAKGETLLVGSQQYRGVSLESDKALYLHATSIQRDGNVVVVTHAKGTIDIPLSVVTQGDYLAD